MATKVSHLFHQIKTFAAEKWEKVVKPSILGGDGRNAFCRVELGIKHRDFYSVAEGMTYLAEDQGQPVTDKSTYRAVRYRMIKERVEAQLGEKISREASPEIKGPLQGALTLVEKNEWSRLSEYDRVFQKHSGTGLLDDYTQGEMRQYNRLPKS